MAGRPLPAPCFAVCGGRHDAPQGPPWRPPYAPNSRGPTARHLTDVLDETPAGVQTIATSCTVTAGSSTCSNTGAPYLIAAGHYLMVQIITPGAFYASWRVSFRY